MPEALMAMTTSPGPGVGSVNSRSSSFRSPRKTTPRMACSSSSSERSADGFRRRVSREQGEVHGLLGDELEEAGDALVRLHHGSLDGGHDLARLGHALTVAAEGARH